jgi:NADPH2:quinone reductase
MEEAPTPTAGPGQVLIRSEAIGVNFVTTMERRNLMPWPSELPASPMSDVVGTVVAVGDGVTTVAVGERVAAPDVPAAYADYVVADAQWLATVPADMDRTLASVLCSPARVALTLIWSAQLREGESVLVHAAAGDIGHLALQLARIQGARIVIGTASSPAKLDFARAHGADFAIDYSADDWPDRVRDVTGGRGVDIVLDSVGGAFTATSIDLLAPFGRLVLYGVASGVPEVPVLNLFGLKSVTGSASSTWLAERPDQMRQGLTELMGLAVRGRLRSTLHVALTLAEVARAHAIIEAREQMGRVLLIP